MTEVLFSKTFTVADDWIVGASLRLLI